MSDDIENFDLYTLLVNKVKRFFTLIYYAFIFSAVIGPIIAVIDYYPEIALPFICGIISGVFFNKHRRIIAATQVKQFIIKALHDTGVTA